MEILAHGSGLDIDAVRRQAEGVLGEPLYWFPVRHHSPATCAHLERALRARRPRVVFIEAPADTVSLVPHIVDARTKPPVAIYSSYRDDDNVLGLAGIASAAPDVPPKFGVWYPMLPYSPEYVAMKTAAELGAEVVFIDLPHRGRIPAVREWRTRDGEESPDEEQEHVDEPGSWEDLAIQSESYRRLADHAGYRSWDECWDSLFEVDGRHQEVETFRRDMAYFCAALRATTPDARMARDGTLAREAFMWRTIDATLREKQLRPEDAVVVCGGFHLFMKREVVEVPPLPAGTVYATVAPYSYFRTSELSGYGAGNRAPRYYELVHHHMTRVGAVGEAADLAMVDHVIAVLVRARREGEALSSADAISVAQHARMLAVLRGRTSPTLDDVRDGLISCCCKGRPDDEGRALLAAMTATEVGNTVGRVTPALGRLPLVYDFYRAIDELGLGDTLEKERKAKVSLDLRDEVDQRKSVLFHRLAQIGLGYAERVSAGSAQRMFHESWRIHWSPKVEAALIENNLHGDTVESAAASVLDEELARSVSDAASVCERLLRATNMDLPGLALRIEATAGQAIDADTRLPSLAQALTHLVVLERQATRKKLRRDIVLDLEQRCLSRACFTIPDAANVPVEEHEAVINGLKSLAEVLLGEQGELFDRELFVQSVQSAYAASTAPYLRGAMCGLLTEMRAQSPDDLARQVSQFALARPEVMVTCGEFLDGAMATSRTAIMLGAVSLTQAIDELLRAADWESFLVLLPRMRKAFERLHERSRAAFAARVAEQYGLAEGEADKLTRLDTSAGAAAWMARVDARVADIMKEWEFA